MSAVIRVEGVAYSYDGAPAVDHVSFEVGAGEVLGFLGPNGAGKTTTLKMMTGLLPVREGTVSIMGMDISRQRNRVQSRIGVCFEEKNHGSLRGNAAALVVSLAVAALMLTEVGLIFGTAAKDSRGLFTLMKSTGVLFMAPVFFYLFPGWPQWIAKLFPTYWVIDPVVGAAVRGESLGGVALTVAVALGLSAALVPAVALTARRVE